MRVTSSGHWVVWRTTNCRTQHLLAGCGPSGVPSSLFVWWDHKVPDGDCSVSPGLGGSEHPCWLAWARSKLWQFWAMEILGFALLQYNWPVPTHNSYWHDIHNNSQGETWSWFSYVVTVTLIGLCLKLKTQNQRLQGTVEIDVFGYGTVYSWPSFIWFFFSPSLMLRILETLKYKWIFGVAGSWILRRKRCGNDSQHFWNNAKYNMCPYRTKCQRAQLELRGGGGRPKFQNTIHPSNKCFHEGDSSPSLFFSFSISSS